MAAFGIRKLTRWPFVLVGQRGRTPYELNAQASVCAAIVIRNHSLAGASCL